MQNAGVFVIVVVSLLMFDVWVIVGCLPFDFYSDIFVLICLLPYGAGGVMILVSKVTAAVRANSRPSTAAPFCTVMEVEARMFPLKTEVVPSVAELPTCQ